MVCGSDREIGLDLPISFNKVLLNYVLNIYQEYTPSMIEIWMRNTETESADG